MSKFFKLTALLLVVLAMAVGIARQFRPGILSGIAKSQVFYDRSGKLMRVSLSADQRFRIFVPLRRMPSDLIEAFLLREDKHFYHHWGVNPFSLARAFYTTYIQRSRRMGASTLTMQLVRLRYGIKSQSIVGKIKQVALAAWLETLYSKKEILEAYLNLAPFGSNIEGVAAASLLYFRKDVAKLTLAESLSLAVIPQNPNVRTLASDDLSAAAQENVASLPPAVVTAREQLLKDWLALHPSDSYQKIEFELPMVRFYPRQLPFEAPHFLNELTQRGLSRESEVRTTLDLNIQKVFERRISDYVRAHADIGVKNATAVLIDIETAEVRAWVGSANFFDPKIDGQVDGVSARRSPGSTLKPLLYGLAIDQGIIHSESLLKDSPFSVAEFDPENFDHDFKGPVPASEALINSRNVPAVYLGSKIHNPNLYDFLKLAHVGKLKPESYYGLAVVLGGTELSLEELAKLYTLLGRGGELTELNWLQGPREAKKESEKTRLLSPEAAYMVEDILARNPGPLQKFSAGVLSSVPTRSAVHPEWKTGTSFGFRDAWTLGIANRYVLGVWLGNFDNESNPAFVGRELAAPLFFQLSEALDALGENKEFRVRKIPKGLRKIRVCSLSGALPGPNCKHTKLSFFIPGKSPIAPCDVHREVLINRATHLRSCDPLAKNLEHKIFEFWPSDILKVFRLAGLPRVTPPPYDKNCKVSGLADYGSAPEITSPRREHLYLIDPEKPESRLLPLQAVTDGDGRKLFWFLDDEFIGKSDSPQTPFIWHAKTGKFRLRAVDDLGRASSLSLEIKLAKSDG